MQGFRLDATRHVNAFTWRPLQLPGETLKKPSLFYSPAQSKLAITTAAADLERLVSSPASRSAVEQVFLLFLALLPQFTDTAAPWPVPMQMIALGLVHTISCGVIYLLVGFGSQVVLRARPAAAHLVSRLPGVIMIIIALVLLIEQLRALV